MDRRFQVEVCISIVENKDGEFVPFTDVTANYADMPYAGIVDVQSAVCNALLDLGRERVSPPAKR